MLLSRKFFKGILLCLFVYVSSVFGASNISVSGNSFDDFQSAIDSASDSDSIKLGNNSYYGCGSQIKVNKSNIVIEGSSRSSGATLDANGDSRIFWINGSNVTIRFVSFVNGDTGGDTGAVIVFRGITLVVDNYSFVGNRCDSSGAIAIGDNSSDVLINNSRFVNNNGIY